jgi:hypothetical protein
LITIVRPPERRMNPMAERECTEDDCKASATEAGASGKLYGPAFVEILDVDPATRTVSFQTAARGSLTPVTVKCTWARNNVWARCPTSLDCDEQRLPAPGSSGTLYLSGALVESKKLDVNVKWPNALAGDDYRPLRIWATSITLRGVELATGQMRVGTLELLDTDQTAPGQTLTLQDRILTINVSQVGAEQQFLVPWPDLQYLESAKAVLAQARASARDKARAWAQVAMWEELLNGAAPHTEEFARARYLLNEIRETAR